MFTVSKEFLVTILVILGVQEGYGRLQGKIINGYSVEIQYFPFMASLQVDGNHICGAAILSSRIILTAAHCDVFTPEFYKVRVGSTHYDRDGLLINVSNVIKHPDYNRKTADYDAAIIVLAEELNFEDAKGTIAAIPLPDKNYSVLTGLGAVVLGWGTTDPNDNSTPSKRLQSASQRMISMAECKGMFPPGAITERMFCAQNYFMKQDACTGDSGGPMYARGQLVGIISWGIACADGTTPGVYTDVPKILNFINLHLKQ